MSEKKKTGKINGENVLYAILNHFNSKNPPDDVKSFLERLLLMGGVWFRPATYKEIPVLLPYVIRDAKCRKKNPTTGKDSRGEANAKGLMKDDNSSIKDIPKSLLIEGGFYGKKESMGNGFVASHIWRKLVSQDILASQWERTNSFVPNLVWLPKQLSKLTDREGSYAQRFMQHVSGLLYREIKLGNPAIDDIWNELKDPRITPVSAIDLTELNYFEHKDKWVIRRNSNLQQELQSIVNILDGGAPTVAKINTSKYVPSLQNWSKSVDEKTKNDLMDWIKANMK